MRMNDPFTKLTSIHNNMASKKDLATPAAVLNCDAETEPVVNSAKLAANTGSIIADLRIRKEITSDKPPQYAHVERSI